MRQFFIIGILILWFLSASAICGEESPQASSSESNIRHTVAVSPGEIVKHGSLPSSREKIVTRFVVGAVASKSHRASGHEEVHLVSKEVGELFTARLDPLFVKALHRAGITDLTKHFVGRSVEVNSHVSCIEGDKNGSPISMCHVSVDSIDDIQVLSETTTTPPSNGVRPHEPRHGQMFVQLKGTIHVLRMMHGSSTRNSVRQDLKTISATIDCAGTQISIDSDNNEAIENELMWWHKVRHGDLREIQAEVTGRLVFRQPADLFGIRQVTSTSLTTPVVTSSQNPIPFVVVDSLRIQLVGPEGTASGSQLNRPTVYAR